MNQTHPSYGGTLAGLSAAAAQPPQFLLKTSAPGQDVSGPQEVPRELEQLHQMLSNLEQSLQILRQRLECVSHAPPDGKGVGACSPSCGSSIGQQINSAFHRVTGLFNSVNDATQNLAI